ncbi:MAG: hypothetical protein WBJ87_08290 [Candidatus Hydrothermia bacterium]
MNKIIQNLRQYLEREKGKKKHVQDTLKEIKNEINELEDSLRLHEEAREIIRLIGQRTQEQLQFHISDLATMAIGSVFDDPYQLKVEFVQRRNKTECDIKFVKKNLEIDPMEASGVGVIDIASFALRVALWSIKKPSPRNVIILDEPFRHLSTNYQPRASEMVYELSKKLGIQFIIVTHENELAREADRLFEVSIHNGVSKIKCDNNE